MREFLKKYVSVLIYRLKGVNELARDAFVCMLYADVDISDHFEFDVGCLFLEHKQLAGSVAKIYRFFGKNEYARWRSFRFNFELLAVLQD
jgi:hypothetical protein